MLCYMRSEPLRAGLQVEELLRDKDSMGVIDLSESRLGDTGTREIVQV